LPDPRKRRGTRTTAKRPGDRVARAEGARYSLLHRTPSKRGECTEHPPTDDDLADHTSLTTWVAAPIPLDLSVLDPPGKNQGVGRFETPTFSFGA